MGGIVTRIASLFFYEFQAKEEEEEDHLCVPLNLPGGYITFCEISSNGRIVFVGTGTPSAGVYSTETGNIL